MYLYPHRKKNVLTNIDELINSIITYGAWLTCTAYMSRMASKSMIYGHHISKNTENC